MVVYACVYVCVCEGMHVYVCIYVYQCICVGTVILSNIGKKVLRDR